MVRHTSDHVRAKYPEITEDMYRCFENNIQNGDLYSDFFTVGKDLGHAFATNDVELVRNGEVKQQSVNVVQHVLLWINCNLVLWMQMHNVHNTWNGAN